MLIVVFVLMAAGNVSFDVIVTVGALFFFFLVNIELQLQASGKRRCVAIAGHTQHAVTWNYYYRMFFVAYYTAETIAGAEPQLGFGVWADADLWFRFRDFGVAPNATQTSNL